MIYQRYFKFTRFSISGRNLPEHHDEYSKQWEKELPECQKKYKIRFFSPEIFFFHHGLRFADKRILNYIKNRDILDCGAFVGDSLLVLRDYTNKNIYCYEFAPQNIKQFEKTVKDNNITNYKLISKAVGEKIEKMCVTLIDGISGCQSLTAQGPGQTVDITTIDSEAVKEKFTVGFIKMDVEGSGFQAIKGAINTIKRDRPVLSLAVYHNTEEFFKIKPYLEANLDNYVYEFELQQFLENDINELTLFCYPKEIVDDNKNADER